uniref:AB hydrolase-1 domain-containing protein n=1 Tax=Phaeomonas parva TaxID=124430 RepID=A0A7S1UAU7_9STRA
MAANPSAEPSDPSPSPNPNTTTTPNLYLSAFSLGGNVCLKLLGEMGDGSAPEWDGVRIRGAAVNCVPFDPAACSPLLSEDNFNRLVYSGNFLKTLVPKAERQFEKLGADAFPAAFDMEEVRAATSIGDFDDAFIAPIYGFADKWDYYNTQGCLSGGYLPKIRVPCFALNAIDDPFIRDVRLPTPDDVQDAPMTLQYTRYGGHCGFLAPEELGGRDWMPRQLARFVAHARDSWATDEPQP